MAAHLARRWLGLVALALLLAPASALAQAPRPVQITQADDTAFPDLTLYLSVNDNRGNPVTGLPASAFRVVEDGQPVTAFTAKPVERTTPLTLVMALDTSNSMGEGSPPTGLTQAQEAATRFVEGLGPNDRVALLSFSGEVTPLLPASGDRAQLKSAIAGLRLGDYTALYEAVAQAVESVNSGQPGREAVVVLTDGINNPRPGSNARSLDEAISLAQARGVPVYALGFGAIQAAELTRLAGETKGQFLRAPGPAEIGDLFNRLAGQLQNQYSVAYRSAINTPGAHKVTVAVTLPEGVQEDTFTLRGIAVPVTVQVVVSVTPAPTQTPIPPTATPRPTATPTPAPPPPPPPPEPGVGWGWWLLPLVAVAALAGGLVWMNRRRTPPPDPLPPDPPPDPPKPPPLAPTQLQPAPRADTVILPERLKPQVIAWLVIERGEGVGQELRLRPEGTTIGRDGHNDIVLNDMTVSRQHAKLRLEADGFTVQDFATTNPTFVNGQPIVKQTLHDGDRIQIGSTVLVFKVIQ